MPFVVFWQNHLPSTSGIICGPISGSFLVKGSFAVLCRELLNLQCYAGSLNFNSKGMFFCFHFNSSWRENDGTRQNSNNNNNTFFFIYSYSAVYLYILICSKLSCCKANAYQLQCVSIECQK